MLSKLQPKIADEELIEMEENKRRNIEVQINRLRNIQVLLNTAVKEMEQYSAVVSQLNPTKSKNQTNSTVLANNVYINPEPTMVESSLNKSDEETTFGHPESPGLPNAVTCNSTNIKSQQNIGSKKTDEKLNEMRKRRIAKFGSTPANSE